MNKIAVDFVIVAIFCLLFVPNVCGLKSHWDSMSFKARTFKWWISIEDIGYMHVEHIKNYF